MVIVGGNPLTNKKSKIIYMIYDYFKQNYTTNLYNGVPCDNISESDITLWMPDIDNKEEKIYPKKKTGSVLICSKVLRDGRTKFDAVSRIFSMNGNAVICITKDSDTYSFELIDALGNTWGDKSSSIETLCANIKAFYIWSSSQQRISLMQRFVPEKEFIEMNKELAQKVQNSIGSRYFGNVSTRCMKLFPSNRNNKDENVFLFSARNSNKEFLTEDDFVIVKTNQVFGEFYGNKKPSVDTPIQLELYKYFKNINYMIHGHAFIKGAIYTEDYFPCGDMREVQSVKDCLSGKWNTPMIILNLKNHGFLIGAENLSYLKMIIGLIKIDHTDILK
jgi:hypothetical protein